MKDIKNILFWIWQLPQNIIGAAMYLFFKIVDKGEYRLAEDHEGTTIMITPSFHGGVSLGGYVFLHKHKYNFYSYKVDIAHEWGHCRQSHMLGWLYLLVVGIPSAVHNVWHRFHKETDYYGWYCEKWADELGGVKRSSEDKRYV